jgi:glyoxylase-like metal-dependent hydrolase (beta-lactamase superfamily II)
MNVLDEDLGIYYWTSAGRTAYAVRGDEGAVLIDPLPLEEEELAELGPVTAIVLTSSTHERAAWQLRSELEVPVWAPALSQAIEEEPDERYGHSTVLPGDLVAFQVPGVTPDQHALILEDYIGFVPDVVRNDGGEGLRLPGDDEVANPVQLRDSVGLLLEQSIDVLCPGHGDPVTDDVHGLLQAALDEAGEAEDPSYVELTPEEMEALRQQRAEEAAEAEEEEA